MARNNRSSRLLRKRSTFDNSKLGAQTDTLTNCGTVRVFVQNGKRSQTVLVA